MGFNPLDPLGIKKKAKKKIKKEFKGTFLGDLVEFEDFQLKKWGNLIKENPEQALLGGLTPFGAKLWGGVTGKDYEPAVNIWGGPTAQTYAEAEAAGIDTGDVQTSHKMAEMVASTYAGGALSDVAGKGLQAYGQTGRWGSEAASKLGPELLKGTATTAPGKYYGTAKKGLTMGAQMAGAGMERTPVVTAPGWDPGPGQYLDPIRGYGRQFYAPTDPYRYGFGPGQIMVGSAEGGLARAAKGGSKKNWIQGAIKKPGALRAALKVKKGEKIPAKKLAAAAKKPGKMGQRARLAQTLKRMH